MWTLIGTFHLVNLTKKRGYEIKVGKAGDKVMKMKDQNVSLCIEKKKDQNLHKALGQGHENQKRRQKIGSLKSEV